MLYDYRKTNAGKRRFTYPRMYWLTWKLQAVLHFFGVAWHNAFSDECTPDFNCCVPSVGHKAWLRIPRR